MTSKLIIQTASTAEIVEKGLKRRYRAEKRFQVYGIVAISIALLFLVVLFTSIISKGYTAFEQTYIKLDIQLERSVFEGQNISRVNYPGLIKKTIYKMFPEVKGRRNKKALKAMISTGAAFQLREEVMENPDLIGKTVSIWVPADDDVDMLMKGHMRRDVTENERRLSDKQLAWIDTLIDAGRIRKQFNVTFFTAGHSREPELAGIWGAMVGSLFALAVTLVLSFPVGVAAAVYLEEFAPKNKLTSLIEVNINNLAAVPSIVFGLLGLSVFLNFFGLPRSAPLVGGLVLSLMTLPTIIIASRASLLSVPPSIREAALGVGASKLQTVSHHVLPLAMPGILTGSIIGMARALGETAPLLMIGMVAFIVDIPTSVTDPSTALPVQIFLWADSPERAFVERTSAATLALLVFLIVMNGLAVFLRKRFERRW